MVGLNGPTAVPTGVVVRVPLPVPLSIVYSPDRVGGVIPTADSMATNVWGTEPLSEMVPYPVEPTRVPAT